MKPIFSYSAMRAFVLVFAFIVADVSVAFSQDGLFGIKHLVVYGKKERVAMFPGAPAEVTVIGKYLDKCKRIDLLREGDSSVVTASIPFIAPESADTTAITLTLELPKDEQEKNYLLCFYYDDDLHPTDRIVLGRAVCGEVWSMHVSPSRVKQGEFYRLRIAGTKMAAANYRIVPSYPELAYGLTELMRTDSLYELQLRGLIPGKYEFSADDVVDRTLSASIRNRRGTPPEYRNDNLKAELVIEPNPRVKTTSPVVVNPGDTLRIIGNDLIVDKKGYRTTVTYERQEGGPSVTAEAEITNASVTSVSIIVPQSFTPGSFSLIIAAPEPVGGPYSVRVTPFFFPSTEAPEILSVKQGTTSAQLASEFAGALPADKQARLLRSEDTLVVEAKHANTPSDNMTLSQGASRMTIVQTTYPSGATLISCSIKADAAIEGPITLATPGGQAVTTETFAYVPPPSSAKFVFGKSEKKQVKAKQKIRFEGKNLLPKAFGKQLKTIVLMEVDGRTTSLSAKALKGGQIECILPAGLPKGEAYFTVAHYGGKTNVPGSLTLQ